MVDFIVYGTVPMPMITLETDEGGKRVKAVQRAFDVVEVLQDSGSLRIADVADALDLPVSTAHVHLKTLESAGYVVRDDDGYRLSFRFLRNGVAVRESQRIYQVCRPDIDELADRTGEVANLGVEERGLRVILYQSEGSDAVYDNAPIGEYTTMHCTALGKAILAERSFKYVETVIDAYGLPEKTSETISNSAVLRSELETIRAQGYVIEDEERRTGIRSIAVPLKADGTLVGAISVSGPKERFSDRRIAEELLPYVKNTKNIVEVKYTYD